jgi:hypothetical protein
LVPSTASASSWWPFVGRDIAIVAGANALAAGGMHISSINAVLAAHAEERLDLGDVEEHQAGVPSDEATGSVV